MIRFPNAKINLGLNVLSRRNDGFHDISTVMLPINFCDILEVLPLETGEVDFSRTGLPVPGNPSDDLCLKAYRMMSEKTGKKGTRIHLHKVIPPGSGLGGGSSDAAAMLLVLNEIFQAGLDQDEMLNMAVGLGSDCPFFIKNKTAHATGKGEILNELNLSLQDLKVFLVMPAIHISTAWAYSMIVPHKPVNKAEDVARMDTDKWKDLLVNDFEEPVFNWYPQLRDIRDKLYESGAIYAAMSGSGSAVFGIFDKEIESLAKIFRGFMTFWGVPG